MILSEMTERDYACTACCKNNAIYTYPAYSEDESYLMLCEGCLAALRKEMSDDIFKIETGCKCCDDYFGKDGDIRMIKSGHRLGKEELENDTSTRNN